MTIVTVYQEIPDMVVVTIVTSRATIVVTIVTRKTTMAVTIVTQKVSPDRQRLNGERSL